MNKTELRYLVYIATLDLNTFDYKILLLLLEKPYNQATLASILQTNRQSIYKCIKKLEEKQLIEVDRTEGRNKFYRLITDLEKLNQAIPGQTKINIEEVEGNVRKG